MTEQADLEAKIAAISGKINERKQNPAAVATPNQHYSPADHHGHPRWSPYRRGPPVHKNKTLVVNNAPSPSSRLADSAQYPPVNEQFVGRGPHQLMNQGTYNREKRRRLQQKRNGEATPGPRIEQHPARELEIDGIRFRLLPDGSKLIRMTGEDVAPEINAVATPRKATISGVVFLRTKHGNLIRDNQKARYFSGQHDWDQQSSTLTLPRRSSQRNAKPQCEHFTKHGTFRTPYTQAAAHLARVKGQLLGTCPFGPRCRFSHDPTKVAICKDYLRTGSCPNGEICDMSHEMSYHRVPACTYFLRGNCTNSACRYPHVHVSPSASVCRPFATLGFCAKGPRCDKRHVSECPDYANHGFCADRENGKCALPHPDRASIMRKVAEREAKLASGAASDVSSDEDKDVMEIDSDVAEELTGSDEDSHEFSQQQDFVTLS